MEKTKVCGICGVEKPLSDYYKASATKDGVLTECKACNSARHKKWYQNNKERHKARAREWYEKNRERAYEYGRKYWRKNRRKKYARSAVSEAIAKGKLPRARDCECADCGKRAEQYHHHAGYEVENYLKVVPLCRACHEHRHSTEYQAVLMGD